MTEKNGKEKKGDITMQAYITLKNGMQMPRLGMGTWFLGENRGTRAQEIAALRAGLDAGMQLIDTAEMYGNGLSEQLIGEAIQGYNRENLFLVSKVYPHNAGKRRMQKSIDQSLKSLRTDYLDLYLLHWRGSIPLSETVECMEELVAQGKIKSWGVSNFDVSDMKELFHMPNGGNCMVNQVLYHLGSRGVEYELLPWLTEHQIPLMAYCPLAQAGDLRRELLHNKVLRQTAQKYQISVLQLLLAFVLQHENVIAIPRSSRKEHVLENWKAREISLDAEDLDAINRAFPAPKWRVPLDIV